MGQNRPNRPLQRLTFAALRSSPVCLLRYLIRLPQTTVIPSPVGSFALFPWIPLPLVIGRAGPPPARVLLCRAPRERAHHVAVAKTIPPVTSKFTSASGSITFQPNPSSWS
jgi:hypothetical protein